MRAHASVPGMDVDATVADPRRLERLRWRCRRGMLENDLVLSRFLDRRGATLSEAEIAALDGLLDLPDGELWDLLCGRAQPEPRLASLLAELNIR